MPDAIDPHPPRDGEQPRACARAARKRGQRRDAAQVGLLGEVVGTVGVGKMCKETPDVFLGASNELGECGSIPLASTESSCCDACVVLVLSCHGIHLTNLMEKVTSTRDR